MCCFPQYRQGPKEKKLNGTLLLVAFFIESRPVRHATVHLAHMDEIEIIFFISPRAAAVIDFKVKVNGR